MAKGKLTMKYLAYCRVADDEGWTLQLNRLVDQEIARVLAGKGAKK